VIRIEIDPLRCKATGVCTAIASEHVRLTGGAARQVPGSVPDGSLADAVVECCPNQAVTVVDEPEGGAVFTVGCPIATLGPAGTDAQAEAAKHTDRVSLCASFPEAMNAALAGEVMALVAAGYIERDGDRVVDSWSDQHFTHFRRLRIVRLWETRTKPMCLAVRTTIAEVADIGSVAVHPATAALLEAHRVPGRRVFVNAKPLAAGAAAAGDVDACIASVDVVTRLPQLRIVERIDPTMVWMLYACRKRP
jgi:ferredoxin